MKATTEKEAGGSEAKLISMAVPQLACLLDEGHNNQCVPQLSLFSRLKYEVNQSHAITQTMQTGARSHTKLHTSTGVRSDKREGWRPSTMIIIAATGSSQSVNLSVR